MLISEIFKIRNILLSIKSAKIPIKTSYQIAKFLQATEINGNFYQEKYQEIITTYAERNEDGSFVVAEDGQSIKIQNEHTKECLDTIKELESMEVETPEILIDAMHLENTDLTVDQICTLMPILIQ